MKKLTAVLVTAGCMWAGISFAAPSAVQASSLNDEMVCQEPAVQTRATTCQEWCAIERDMCLTMDTASYCIPVYRACLADCV